MSRHVQSILFRPTLLALWVALGSMLASGQLQLTPPPLPAEFFNEPIDGLEKQIASITTRQRDAEAGPKLALESQKQLRVIARNLLVASRNAHGKGEEVSVATLHALTLVDGLEAFDKLTTPLPQAAIDAINAKPRDEATLSRLRQAIEGLKAFNTLAADEQLTLRSIKPRDVDAYLQRVLAPLAITAEALGQPAPTSTWAAADTRLGPRVTAKSIDQLASRVGQVGLKNETRGEIRWMLDMMRRGLDRPQFRPRVALFHDQLSRLLDVTEAYDKAKWLTDTNRAAFADQAHTAVMLYKSPQTRHAGEARLEQLARMRRLMGLMNDLASMEGLPIDQLRAVFITAQRLAGGEDTRAAAAQLVVILEQIAGAVSLQRNDPNAHMPLDIRRVKQVLQRSYVAQEKQLFDALGELVDDPKAATSPRWTARAAQLYDLGRQVHYLNQIHGWVGRMAKFNPRSARGLYKQLRLIAEDLLNAGTNAGAAAALAEMERQLSLFEQLPFEKPMTGGDQRYAQVVGGHGGAIANQLTVLRSSWAAAWSQGADPTLHGKRLLLMRRLFIAAHDATGIANQRDAMRRLNRWAGWRIPHAAIEPLRRDIPNQLRTAAQQAGSGDYKALEATLDRIDARAPTLWLTWRATRAMDAATRSVPTGVSGMLSQALYGPKPDAWGGSHREQIAAVSIYLHAADNARRAGKRQANAALMRYAGQVAQQVLDALDQAGAQPVGQGKAVGPIDL